MTREELAWAAGLFDGEGNVRRHSRAPRGRGVPVIQIAQGDRQVLDRFKQAVKVGKVYGPYGPYGRTKAYFLFSSGGFEASQAIMAMLWAFLSPVKREQFRKTFVGYAEAA